MPDPNLPDDWGSYYVTCSRCGKRYHLSGSEQCACLVCVKCNKLVAPDEAEVAYDLDECLCRDCHEAPLRDVL